MGARDALVPTHLPMERRVDMDELGFALFLVTIVAFALDLGISLALARPALRHE